MKKYFIAALSLAALVACSKDELPVDPVLDSSQKSVSISIANMASDTRAVGGTTTGQTADVACTTVDKLIFLFADKDGNVLDQKAWDNATTGNTITFHRISEQVTKIGVIGNVAPTATYANLSEAVTAWKNETAEVIAGEYTAVVAYGVDEELTNSGHTCTVDGTNYPLMNAEVTVAPYMSRIEIGHIGCTDLGTKYSKIGLTGLSLAGGTVEGGSAASANAAYTHTLGTFDASTDWDTATNALKAAHTHGSDSNVIAPADGKVWSWNILPQAVSDLTLGVYVVGNGYTVQIPDKTVTVTKYRSDKQNQNDQNNGTADNTSDDYMSKFNSSNIYKFNIDFKEANIDNDTQYLCVDVNVTIADWVVNNVDVSFKAN